MLRQLEEAPYYVRNCALMVKYMINITSIFVQLHCKITFEIIYIDKLPTILYVLPPKKIKIKDIQYTMKTKKFNEEALSKKISVILVVANHYLRLIKTT